MDMMKLGEGLIKSALGSIAGWYVGVGIDAFATLAHIAGRLATADAPIVLAMVAAGYGILALLKK